MNATNENKTKRNKIECKTYAIKIRNSYLNCAAHRRNQWTRRPKSVFLGVFIKNPFRRWQIRNKWTCPRKASIRDTVYTQFSFSTRLCRMHLMVMVLCVLKLAEISTFRFILQCRLFMILVTFFLAFVFLFLLLIKFDTQTPHNRNSSSSSAFFFWHTDFIK